MLLTYSVEHKFEVQGKFNFLETVIQTVSIPNKPDSLKFYFRINI